MIIHIVQKPVEVSYICVDCKAEINEDYDSFCEKYGDNPYDQWENNRLKCPECGSWDTPEFVEYG